MRRGEVWTLRDDRFASKARPTVVVQSDALDSFNSIVVCLMTTYPSDSIPTRVKVLPTPENGLREVSYIMTEKFASVGSELLGKRLGALDAQTMEKVSKQLKTVLGL